MFCKRCSSENLGKFSAEINVHFPGREGLDKPTVWLFPEVVVCLDCGFAEFSIPQAQLLRLATQAAA
jgi:hypothetical protein